MLMPLVVASALSLAPGSSHLVQQYLLSFGTGFTTTVFLLYTVCFCARLGFGDDIETAEAKRSRRLGQARVSSWAADAPDRKTQVDAADRTSQMPVVVFEEPEEIDE